jgi:chaperone required for assembly of F1-ATPase
MKRFYQTVTTERADGTWQALLDGKPILTPKRRPLSLPTEALAEAIAAEWREQGEQLQLVSMRLTRLATTVIDLLPEKRDAVIREIVAYLATDLLCYRASHPADLVRRQGESWQPWLDWLASAFDVRLPAFEGVLPQEVPPEAHARLKPVVEAMDSWRLMALHAAVTTTGSIVLGLAMVEAVLPAGEAFEAARLDESYLVDHWGEDPEIVRRHHVLRQDLEAVEQFVAALAPSLRM